MSIGDAVLIVYNNWMQLQALAVQEEEAKRNKDAQNSEAQQKAILEAQHKLAEAEKAIKVGTQFDSVTC